LKKNFWNKTTALSFFLWGVFCWPLSVEAASTLQKARINLENGKLEEAKSHLKDWLQLHPVSPEGLLLLGQVFLAGDQPELAQKQVEELMRIRPEWAGTNCLHGQVLLRLGAFEEAESAIRKSLHQNPSWAEAYIEQGRLQLSRMETQQALASFKKAISLNPRLPDAYYYSAEASGGNRDSRAQIAALEKYLVLRPAFPEFRVRNARSMLQFLKASRHLELGRVDSKEPQHEIAVESFFGLMIVRGFVNGKGPYKFLVDTGASTSVLSNTLYDSLGVQPLATAVIRCVGGSGTMVTRMGIIKRLTLGTLDISNLPVVTFDNSQMASIIDGVLSPADLAEFIISFKPAIQKMILSCRDCVSRPHPPEESGSGRSFDIRMIGNLFLLPVSLPPQLSGRFLFDTGALMSALSLNTAKALGATVDQASTNMDLQFAGACGVTQSVIPLKDVTLKIRDLQKNYPQILGLDLEEVSKELQSEILGILGMDFWGENHGITIDYATGHLWVE
jgi:predicted aspartyl protease/predicted negative regulator of RcsB-dependent stress response